jgi:hypothetical protein
MDQQFGIAVGSKTVAQSFKALALLGMVEKFSVVDHGDTSVLVEDRLPTVFEADDAQAAGSETEAGADQFAAFVRPAVQDRAGHRAELLRMDFALPVKIDDSRNATHGFRCRLQTGGHSFVRNDRLDQPSNGKRIVTRYPGDEVADGRDSWLRITKRPEGGMSGRFTVWSYIV